VNEAHLPEDLLWIDNPDIGERGRSLRANCAGEM
jgi:hypothetical protein